MFNRYVSLPEGNLNYNINKSDLMANGMLIAWDITIALNIDTIYYQILIYPIRSDMNIIC